MPMMSLLEFRLRYFTPRLSPWDIRTALRLAGSRAAFLSLTESDSLYFENAENALSALREFYGQKKTKDFEAKGIALKKESQDLAKKAALLRKEVSSRKAPVL